jgi:hypothetical protein
VKRTPIRRQYPKRRHRASGLISQRRPTRVCCRLDQLLHHLRRRPQLGGGRLRVVRMRKSHQVFRNRFRHLRRGGRK